MSNNNECTNNNVDSNTFNNTITIIPMGEECYTCMSIDKKFNNNIRKFGLPYDYVGHTYISNIAINLKDIISKLNNYSLNIDDFVLKLFNNNYFFVHNKYGFKYWHDTNHTSEEKFNEQEKKDFILKYNKRYCKLLEILTNTSLYNNSNNNNIIILSVCHFDDIYTKKNKIEDVKNLYEVISLINENIIMYAVNYSYDDNINNITKIENNYKKLYIVNLPVDYTHEFKIAKNNFTNKLYSFVNFCYENQFQNCCGTIIL